LCGGDHLNRDCPKKRNTVSTPACCNRKLAQGEKPHPSDYRGCSHAKDEIRCRNSQREAKNSSGSGFLSKLYDAESGLREITAKQQETTAATAGPTTPVCSSSHKHSGATEGIAPATRQTKTGQPVPGSLDGMFRTVSVAQPVITEVSGAVPAAVKIMSIIKITINLMKENGK
jgi:hypothetical protein